MKPLITPQNVKAIFLFYGVALTEDEIVEETDLINGRLLWDGETKTAVEICHQYAEQRAMLDFGDGVNL